MLPKNFAADRLRHKVEIQQNDGTQGATGGENEVWSTITDGACWAYIETAGVQERFTSQQFVASATHRLVVRYLDGVDPKMRVMHGSRYFDILGVSIEPEEVPQWLVLDCREIK